MTKGNSPFGAWVVCVYRLEAVESPAWINATICAFFVSLQKMAWFLAEQGRTPKNLTGRILPMENEELAQRPSFVQKIGKIFTWCDSKIINIHMRLVKSLLDKEEQARAQGLINKKGFNTAGGFITWLMAFPCHASKYSTHKYKQAFVRICFSAVLAFLPATLLLVFSEQVFPSYKDFFKEYSIVIWAMMTAVMLYFLLKFGLVLIRIVTSMLILAILMASFAFLFGDVTSETRSIFFIVFEVVMAVFFLLWNFWSKGKKQENDEAV